MPKPHPQFEGGRVERNAADASDPLARIRARFPWPEERPHVAPIPWSMDYGGRRLITDAIKSRNVRVVLEIGSFLGGSARQWLAAGPDVVVVCIDPWKDIVGPRPLWDKHPLGRAFGAQLREVAGVFNSFLSSMWDVRNRVIAVRGLSAVVARELHALGLEPDLIYIDADKKGNEIAECDALFPDALIGGDDWNWSDGYGFPIRAPAYRSTRTRNRFLKHYGNTWLIDDRPWSLRERILQCQAAPRGTAQVLHSLLRRLRGKTSSGSPRQANPGSAPAERPISRL